MNLRRPSVLIIVLAVIATLVVLERINKIEEPTAPLLQEKQQTPLPTVDITKGKG